VQLVVMMKIMICCSKHFYDRIPAIKAALEQRGHTVTLPNSYDAPLMELSLKAKSAAEHAAWKRSMLRKDKENIAPMDAILVLNFEKNGQPNYIGGATFMEIATAFTLEKKIFLYNPIPESIFKDELLGICPTILEGNLSRIG
jgi:hypothetical protein